MAEAVDVVIALGSNIGDRQKYIRLAIDAIGNIPETILINQSDLLETQPVGPIEQDLFINAAIVVKTQLDAHCLLSHLNQIEKTLGRDAIQNRIKWGPRVIDLDIIFFANQIINDEILVVPHPQMHLRTFVLKPLLQIAPQWEHPILKRTVAQMLLQLEA